MSTIDTSGIDETKPATGSALTANMRSNFAAIKTQLGNAATDIDGKLPSSSVSTFMSTVLDDTSAFSAIGTLKSSYVVATKAEAAALTLTSADAGRKIFITSDDGGEFTVEYNATPGTYADNGGSYCGTQFIPTGGDGTIGIVRDYSGAINVLWFGAKGDGTTEDTTSVQTAINVAEVLANTYPATGAVYVRFPAGTYLLGQITHKDRLILLGDGTTATELKAKDGLNDHFIVSDGFSSLTGTNVWTQAEGVLVFIGYEKLRINGNKANQTAGDGVRLYAKGLYFNDVIITQAYSNGLYTECGEAAGVNNWSTLPEGNAGLLQINQCDGHGWHMRGPHDLFGMKLLANINGGDGLRVESSSGVYLGNMDFNTIHCYANTGKGVNIIGTGIRCSLLRIENSQQEGLYFNNADNVQIGIAHVFDNCKTSGDFQTVIDANSQHNFIGNLYSRRQGRAASGGIQIIGDNNTVKANIRGDVTGGGNATGVGCDIADSASYNNLDLIISEFSGIGATGLRTGNTSGINWNNVRANLSGNTTQWNNVNAGANNHYKVTGSVGSGNTSFTGAAPSTGTTREIFDVTLRDTAPTIYLSESLLTATVDLNTTTEQTFNINHNLITTPNINDILLGFTYTGGNTTWAMQYMRVSAVSATQITIKVKLSTAAGVAHNGSLNVLAKV